MPNIPDSGMRQLSKLLAKERADLLRSIVLDLYTIHTLSALYFTVNWLPFSQTRTHFGACVSHYAKTQLDVAISYL